MGRNHQGQLGLGHKEDQWAPQKLEAPGAAPITDVALGVSNSAFIAGVPLRPAGILLLGERGAELAAGRGERVENVRSGRE